VWRFGSFNAVVLFPKFGIPSGASGRSWESWVPYSRFPRAEILTNSFRILFSGSATPAFYFLGFWFLQQAFYGLASLEALPTSVWRVVDCLLGTRGWLRFEQFVRCWFVWPESQSRYERLTITPSTGRLVTPPGSYQSDGA